MLGDTPFTRLRRALPAGVLFVASALLFLLHARLRPFPPDKEQLDYVIVAQNLAEGRGFVEDVVWSFLRHPPALTHAAFDYWMPLTSILIAPFTAFDDPRWPIVPIALVGAAAVTLAYLLLDAILDDQRLAFAGAALFAATPKVVDFASSTDATLVYAAFVLGALLLFERLARPDARPRHAVALGTLVGLAVLTRADAVAILPSSMVVAWLISRRLGRAAPSGQLLAIGGLAMAPWVLGWSLRCLLVFRAPWNPASARVSGLSTYADALMFSRPSHGGALARVLADPRAALASKLSAAGLELKNLFGALPVPAIPLVLVGVVVALRRRTLAGLAYPMLFVPIILAYGGVLDALQTVGGGARASTVLIPCVYGLALSGGVAILGFASQKLAPARSGAFARAVGFGAAGFGGLVLAATVVTAFLPVPEEKNVDLARSRFYADLEQVLAKTIPKGAPVMTNQPLELNYATGRATIVAPLEAGLETVCPAASRYGVRHLVLIDDDLLRSRLAMDLTELLGGGIFPPRFELLKDAKPVYRVWSMTCPATRAGEGEVRSTR